MRKILIDQVMEALASVHPRAVHYSELANLTGLDPQQVSSALNNRILSEPDDLIRIRRGFWQFVPKETDKPKASVKKPDVLPEKPTGKEGRLDTSDVPSLLEVIGKMQNGLLVRDPDTQVLYQAKPL